MCAFEYDIKIEYERIFLCYQNTKENWNKAKHGKSFVQMIGAKVLLVYFICTPHCYFVYVELENDFQWREKRICHGWMQCIFSYIEIEQLSWIVFL